MRTLTNSVWYRASLFYASRVLIRRNMSFGSLAASVYLKIQFVLSILTFTIVFCLSASKAWSHRLLSQARHDLNGFACYSL